MPKKNIRLAKKLGAAYKKGYPVTYLKNQTKPIYRKQRPAQEKELKRLIAATGMEKGMAMAILINKYKKKHMKFLKRS
jgi:predicted aconitase